MQGCIKRCLEAAGWTTACLLGLLLIALLQLRLLYAAISCSSSAVAADGLIPTRKH
jgi:hypothetical protein